jgi:hypothetical protein
MNFKLTLVAAYLLLSIGSYGHALKDRLNTCEQKAPSEKVLRYCPLVAMFNSIVWPLYWSYQMHK